MVRFQIEKYDDKTAIISALGRHENLDQPASYNYIIRMNNILAEMNDLPSGFNYSQLDYQGYLYCMMENNNVIPVGYHNYQVDPDYVNQTGGQLPPNETDGSLRFTGLPYIQSHVDSSKTVILGNGYFGGAITINHPVDINPFLRHHETGEVYWGLDPNSYVQLGTWSYIDSFDHELPLS